MMQVLTVLECRIVHDPSKLGKSIRVSVNLDVNGNCVLLEREPGLYCSDVGPFVDICLQLQQLRRRRLGRGL